MSPPTAPVLPAWASALIVRLSAFLCTLRPLRGTTLGDLAENLLDGFQELRALTVPGSVATTAEADGVVDSPADWLRSRAAEIRGTWPASAPIESMAQTLELKAEGLEAADIVVVRREYFEQLRGQTTVGPPADGHAGGIAGWLRLQASAARKAWPTLAPVDAIAQALELKADELEADLATAANALATSGDREVLDVMAGLTTVANTTGLSFSTAGVGALVQAFLPRALATMADDLAPKDRRALMKTFLCIVPAAERPDLLEELRREELAAAPVSLWIDGTPKGEDS